MTMGTLEKAEGQTISDFVDDENKQATEKEQPSKVAAEAEGIIPPPSASSSSSATKNEAKDAKEDDEEAVLSSNSRKKQSTTPAPPIENDSPSECQSRKIETLSNGPISKPANHTGPSGETAVPNDDTEKDSTSNAEGDGNGDQFDVLDVVRKRALMEHQEISLHNGELIATKHPEDVSNSHESQTSPRPRPPLHAGGESDGMPMQSGGENSADHQEGDTFDVMDVVRKRARIANEETSLNNQQELLEEQQSEISISAKEQQQQPPVVLHHGAYAGSPGSSLHRRDDIRFSLVGVQPQDSEFNSKDVFYSLVGPRPSEDNFTSNLIRLNVLAEEAPTQQPSSSGTITVDGVAKAMPVTDEAPPNMEARPFDVESAQKRRKERGHKKQRKSFLLLALVFAFIIAVGIILGVLLRRSSNNNNVDFEGNQPPPTVTPSMLPTLSPSFSPFGALNLLRKELPEHTLENLDHFGSPQWKAWEWLLNHNNVSNLAEWRKKQLFALATFYFSFQGDNWYRPIRERWVDDTKEECNWYSTGLGYLYNSGEDGLYRFHPLPTELQTATCNESGEFTSLYLEALRLSGFTPSMPPEIALLSSLSIIWLEDQGSNVSLGHILPSQLGQLSNLTKLYLVLNGFTGQLPTELGLMTALRWVSITRNHLQSSLPTELGLITSLEKLSLHQNGLTGVIPSELGHLTRLTELSLFSNSLTGPIPSELGLATSLTSLHLSGSRLTGSFPSELCLLTGLTSLFLRENTLKGTLPSMLGTMTNLISISLEDNIFSGEIPTQLGLIKSLEKLELHNNSMTGTIPTELAAIDELETLWLSHNSLTGPLPSEFGLATKITRLWLWSNRLAGALPSELALLPNLYHVLVQDNLLTGTIPSELEISAVNGTLNGLNIANNSFSGEIPEGLCSLGISNTDSWSDLWFECNDQLCGCCWCPCPSSNVNSGC